MCKFYRKDIFLLKAALFPMCSANSAHFIEFKTFTEGTVSTYLEAQ